jgi:hypothetical protein
LAGKAARQSLAESSAFFRARCSTTGKTGFPMMSTGLHEWTAI